VTVLEMVEKALRDGGFDGLYNPDRCACLLEDLAPCAGLAEDCEAGYRLEGCSDDCSIGPCDFHVGPVKPTAAESGTEGPT